MDNLYLNVPICLIEGATENNNNLKESCSKIISYAIYDKYKDLEHGTDEEKMDYVFDKLGISNPSWSMSLQKAEKAYLHNTRGFATFGIRKNLVFQFRDEYKTDYEIVVFCAFCAVKSILGKKSYTRMSNNFLLARMAGFNSTENIEELPDSLLKYTNRRMIDKVKNSLELDWGLKRYGKGVQGNYVSFKLSYEELFRIVEGKKLNNKEARLKEEKRVALLKVKEELKQIGNAKNVHR